MTTSTDAGNTTQLDCNATGNQKLIFTWFKNGQKIYVNGRVRLNYTPTSSHLIIKRTISKDGGSYTCEVKNSFGKEEKQMTLKIRGKAIISF